jgi:hypothetical protein
LPGPNALAYLAPSSMTKKKKCYNIVTCFPKEKNSINFVNILKILCQISKNFVKFLKILCQISKNFVSNFFSGQHFDPRRCRQHSLVHGHRRPIGLHLQAVLLRQGGELKPFFVTDAPGK